MEFRVSEELQNRAGIYVIRNVLDDRFYIGSAKNLYKRFDRHKRELSKNIHANCKLQRFVNKYGLDKLYFCLLETVSDAPLLEREQRYLDVYRPYVKGVGFNIAMYAAAPTRGLKKSEKSKKLMSLKFSGAKNPFYGKTHTHECKLKRSIKNGRKINKIDSTGAIVATYDSPYLAAQAESLNSVCLTDACRNNKKYLNHYWQYISEPKSKAAFTDKVHTEESKLKISLAKGTKVSCEKDGVKLEFPNPYAAAMELGFDAGNIRQACRANKSYHGWTWKYEELPKNSGRVGDKSVFGGKNLDQETLIKMSRNKSGPVLQSALDGTFIKEHPSLIEAHLETGFKKDRIHAVCLFAQNQFKGFIFRFKNPIRIKSKDKRKLVAKNDRGDIIHVFENVYQAAECTNGNSTLIRKACVKQGGYHMNFYWEFEEI